MNDRELLELAAKAAEVKLTAEWRGHRDYKPEWNPLEDDGEALRLAVKLRLNIEQGSAPNHPFVPAVECYLRPDGRSWPIEDLGTDPCAATRRAIVRAAAELGATHD